MMKYIPIHQTKSVPRRKTRIFLLLALAVICTLATQWPMIGKVFAESGNLSKQTQVRTDAQLLEGRWVRPDGGYILQLWGIEKDGSISASYYNPRPINVFSAKWSQKEGMINLVVELRDVNYPGSKYILQYDPKSDRLKGTYFQAVEKQTFDIEFVRFK